MFDLLRDLTKSAEEKRQEQITAFVDGELSLRERQRFEQRMADEPELRREVAELQQFKQNLRQLPRRRIPRNFTLDPAAYRAPQPQPLFQLYPVMRAATVLTAVFLLIAITADLLTLGGASNMGFSAEPVAMESQTASESAMDAADDAVNDLPVVPEQEEMAEEDTAESANMTELAPAEELPPSAQLEMAVETEEAIEEMVEAEAEAPAEEPMIIEASPEKATPISIEGESNAFSEESGPGSGAEETSEDAVTAQTAAVTPTSAATATTDTPRVQPTPTLADRAATALPAATEVAEAAEMADEFERDVSEAPLSTVPSDPTSNSISALRMIQIALATLLVVLGTAVWIVRRQR